MKEISHVKNLIRMAMIVIRIRNRSNLKGLIYFVVVWKHNLRKKKKREENLPGELRLNIF